MSIQPTQQPRPGNTRVTGKEQFYTPSATAEQVVNDFLSKFPQMRSRTWVEPAGGTGTFIDAAIKAGVLDVHGYDIEPHHPLVHAADFLALRPSLDGVVCFGNPPFGRNNALSVPMFNACARISEMIVFIVPRSWRKWSVLNRLDRRFHVVDDNDLNVNYVDVDGIDKYERSTLLTCVQSWKRQDEPRSLVKIENRDIVQRCGPLDADASLTIFGYGCGKVRTEFPRKPNTTQMFLRLIHPQALEALQAVNFQKFSTNVAYTQALAFSEISCLLNEHIYGDPGLVETASAELPDNVLF